VFVELGLLGLALADTKEKLSPFPPYLSCWGPSRFLVCEMGVCSY